MKICKNCNAKNEDSSKFCIDCGEELPKEYHVDSETSAQPAQLQKTYYGTTPKNATKITETFEIADFGPRFVAYIIDAILLSLIFGGFVFSSIGFTGGVWLGANSTMWFVYFVLAEYFFNTTLGKYIMELEVVNLDGQPPEILAIIINSLAKAYLLPIDIILGWILVPTSGDKGRRDYGVSLEQRLSQYYMNLVVVKSSRERLADKVQNFRNQ